jgi:hypothetical protein
LHHGAGAAHFALSLFLKELAVVVKTGDRARIDEFFEGLMTTDFFVTYGLFSVGAHAGNVAYSRYLSRFVKPRFVSGILRTNVVLATGLALPEIVHGEFSGRSFAINLTSLGLSATAVKAGLSGIKWVVDLERARRTGTLARTGAKLGRLARMGGWFFTAVETAVVLYFGDEIAKAINSHLSDREARNAVADATANALAASAQGTDDAFERALDALGNAHVDYRNHLLQPLGAVEALYHSRLVRAATKAKLLADQRSAARERLLRYPALRRDVVERFGSTAGYLEAMQRQAEADVDADLSEAMTAYERAREKVLSAAYHAPRRESPYLPEGTGSTFWRGLGLRPAARTLSANRVQAYEDELAALEALAMAAARHPTRVAAVEEAIARTREIQRRDEALARDAAEGMNEAVSRIAAGGD